MPLSSKTDIDNLVSDLNAGKIAVIINADSNPVYNFPADYNFAESFEKAVLKISISELVNETTALSDYLDHLQ